MMFERFTERARQVIVLGQDEARALKHNYIGTEHLLLGLLREEEGIAARVLAQIGVTLEDARAYVSKTIGEGDEVMTGQIPFTPRARKIIELSLREALSLGHNYIGTEHLLLGLVRETEGVAARFLMEQGLDFNEVRNAVIELLSGRRPTAGRWDRAGVDLTDFFTRSGHVYRVVAIADAPTVTLEDVANGERQHHVIDSPNFAQFSRLRPEEAA